MSSRESFHSQQPLKHIYTLISVLVIGFLSIVFVHLYFEDLMEKLDLKTENQYIRVKIGEYISIDIIELKSLFFELSASTNNIRGIQIVKSKIEKKVEDIEMALSILENGGLYERMIYLNIVGQPISRQSLLYTKEESLSKYSIEAIDIRPKLKEVCSTVRELEKLLILRNKNISSHKHPYGISMQIRRINKLAPATFSRMIENINRIVYEGSIELDELKSSVVNKKHEYTLFEALIISITIFLTIIVTYIIGRELLKLNRDLENRLYIDELTGLQSRYSLIEAIKNIENPILMIVDIDSFKQINELYGVEIGNRVLINLGRVIQAQSLRMDYESYRLSGDEFVIFGDRDGKRERDYIKDVENLIEKIKETKVYINELHEFIDIDVTVAISVAKENILSRADMALTYAKENKKPFVTYNDTLDLTTRLQNNLRINREIGEALAEDRFLPFFQPIVNRDGKIVKYEALVRMETNEDGEIKYLSPFIFLDIAIKHKKYRAISKIVVEKSFQKIRERGFTVSINLTYSDINDLSFHSFLKDMLIKYRVQDRVIFEITESENIQDYQKLKEFIIEFRKFRVKFAIDDFGTGFSNFSQILEIAPDFLKIDGSLIKNIDKDRNSYELVKAISLFCKELKIESIAEFVYNRDVYKIAHDLGVDQFQGYLFGKPEKEIE